MNKIMIIVSMILFVFLFNRGSTFNRNANALKEERIQIIQQNDAMSQELKQKELLVKRSPVEINKAFSLFINLMRVLENYSGERIELSFIAKGEKNNLEDLFIDSTFRNVKSLPIDLKIDNFSKEMGVGSVLNDIYILEKQTDLKINEITDENNLVEVKGELYGI